MDKRFTVWVGGIEVNDHYLTYEESKSLYDQYKEKGHDDIVVVEMQGTILASVFLRWYLSDESDLRDLGRDVATALQNSGYYNMTIKRLFDACGYIPSHICNKLSQNFEEEFEFEPEDLIFIDDITEQEQCPKCKQGYTGDVDYCPNCGNCVS